MLEHLPERDRPGVKRRLREAWALEDHDRALDRLKALGAELEHGHPGAAASLGEGLAETLTLTRLGVSGALKWTLASTNPCESMIECVRRTSRNVKRWSSGEMALRWTAAGMLEAERQFRRVGGYPTSRSWSSRSSAISLLAPNRRRSCAAQGNCRRQLSLVMPGSTICSTRCSRLTWASATTGIRSKS